MPDYLLAIDQGTTSTRAILFDAALAPVATAQQEFTQIYPAPGLVEHDPEDIWATTIATVRAAMAKAGAGAEHIAALGITNQRETTIVWDRADRPAHPQRHRLAGPAHRRSLRGAAAAGHEPAIAARTGLLLDPYFSATKIGWLLDHVAGARAAARAGRLAFGTVDSFLLWRLTGGKLHATDATNAARTLLLDIRRGLLGSASVRPVRRAHGACCRRCAIAPATSARPCRSCSAAPIRILGVAGDQQAATIGQGCFQPGMMKSTYGTGCFALAQHRRRRRSPRSNRLLTTIAYQLGGKRTYALEGAIFIAGAAVQWLRDALKVIGAAPRRERARRSRRSRRAGLSGAGLRRPRRALVGCAGARRPVRADPQLRGGRDRPRHARGGRLSDPRPARSHAGRLAGGRAGTVLRVDGGMAASDVTMQFVADILAAPVDRPAVMETTALGAAYLAGAAAGLCPDLAGFASTWKCERRFEPRMDAATRERKWAGWRDAVARTLTPR